MYPLNWMVSQWRRSAYFCFQFAQHCEQSAQPLMNFPKATPPKPTVESSIQQQYDALADIYDQRWQRYLSRTLLFFKDWTNIPPAASVLDIACGTGELERLILQTTPTQSIVGIDISERMLSQAQAKLKDYPNISLRNATASKLPFPNNTFDLVVSANAFHYFPSPTAAIAEMHRVLKPGGKAVILDWCKDFLLCRICDWLLPLLDPAYRQCYTEAELRHFFSDASLRVSRSQRIRFGLVWGLLAIEGIKQRKP